MPSVASFVSYAARLLGVALTLWLWPLILGVLLPAFLIRRWNGTGWNLMVRDRSAVVVLAAGALGVGQFFLVHAEPRLLGPYALCLAIGIIAVCVPQSAGTTGESRRAMGTRGARGSPGAIALSYAGYLIAIPLAVLSLTEAFDQRAELASRELDVRTGLAPVRSAGIDRPRIVVIGYAFPVLADAWRANGRVVAQVRPSSALELAKLAPDRQQRITTIAFSSAADVLWFADADGSIRMSRVIK